MNVGYIIDRNKVGLFCTKMLCANLTTWPFYYSDYVVWKNNSFHCRLEISDCRMWSKKGNFGCVYEQGEGRARMA